MTVLANNFEGGTLSSSITVGNSGGGSGNAWNLATIGSGGTLVYDTTEVAHGSLSCKLASTTAASTFLQWNTAGSLQPGPTWFFRGYFYFTANPAANLRLVNLTNSSAGSLMSVQLTTAGKLLVSYSSVGTLFVTFTDSVPLNAWFRLEGFLTASATVGQVSASLFFTNIDETTPDETHTSTATLNTGSSATGTNSFSIGDSNALGSNGPYWVDDVGVSDTAALGPALVTASLTATTLALAAPLLSLEVDATLPLTAAGLTLGAPLLAPQASSSAALTTPSVTLAAPLLTPESSPVVALTAPGISFAAPLLAPAASSSASLTAPNLALNAPALGPQASSTAALTTPGVSLAAPLLTPQSSAAVSLTAPGVILAAPLITPGQTSNPIVHLTTAALSLAAPLLAPAIPAVTFIAGAAETAWEAGIPATAWEAGAAAGQWEAGIPEPGGGPPAYGPLYTATYEAGFSIVAGAPQAAWAADPTAST